MKYSDSAVSLSVDVSQTSSSIPCPLTCLEWLSTMLSHLFGVVVHHAGGVVHGQADLVLPLAGLRPPQPDLVFPELTGDVGDHLPHVQTLPCAVVPPVEPHHMTFNFTVRLYVTQH